MINYLDSILNLFFIDFNNLYFNKSCNLNLIYYLIVLYNSNYRQGSRSQKNRSLVSYSTKKIYRQKTTGMSRVGSRGSPIRVGGGRAFPNFSFENFKKKINKKKYRLSLKIILFFILKKNNFFLIEDIFFINFKTKLLFLKIKKLFLKNLVFLTLKINKKFFFSSKNLINFNIIYLYNINPNFLLKFSNIFISLSSLKIFRNILL